ncbi:unnamed protein product [Ilex paraguariensis]|uniref:endo-polygalacturonase n=1 Tax=Ilex paraguariensis TaxID=185542 RepID=A0ABC8RQ71_9AQUA
MDIFALVFIIGLVSSNIAWSNAEGNPDSFNVLDYGAVGDGNTDDSKAFLVAWKAACSAETGTPEVVIPEETTFLVYPIIFTGPCMTDTINFTISGTIIAPNSPSVWEKHDASQWLAFSGVTGLIVDGMGMIDGQGKGWWDQSCKYHPDLEGCTKLAPTSLKLLSCNESSLSNIRFTNSPQTHVLVRGCNGLKVDNVLIQSPGNSPNTDGVHIHASRNLVITNSKIGSGDDCISIGDYTSNIYIAHVECGPGHGISIGSLGKGGNFVQVENIEVRNACFKGTTNGARIKTWQVGKGFVRKVTFENLEFNSVKNPLIIDQNYCNIRGACKEQSTGVQISNVIYKGMVGTSTTEIAINLNCSRSVPCHGISMESIQLKSDRDGKEVTATCIHAHGQETGVVPGPCLHD